MSVAVHSSHQLITHLAVVIVMVFIIVLSATANRSGREQSNALYPPLSDHYSSNISCLDYDFRLTHHQNFNVEQPIIYYPINIEGLSDERRSGRSIVAIAVNQVAPNQQSEIHNGA